ncbi:MAG: GerMN domain-containing protein [Chloroflexia bacterium]
MALKPLISSRLALCAILLALSVSLAPQARNEARAGVIAAPAIAQRFQAYYAQHQGLRVLGNPVGEPLFAYTYPAQYFEKGRIEDHRGESGNPEWAFAYGLLTGELMEGSPNLLVSATSLTYADIRTAHAANLRTAPPASYKGGNPVVSGSGVFIPFDAGLGVTPGYIVPNYFWDYINRPDLFPGGWLHDVGLPMTMALEATVVKNNEQRTITLQAFERAVLSYDPKNPADFRVERGNIGADATGIINKPQENSAAAIQLPAPNARVTLPLHVVARFKGADAAIEAELRWSDGTVFSNTLQVLREDGDPIVVDSINWLIEGEPPRPAAPQATLTLKRLSGEVIAKQNVTVLHYDSPETQQVKLYWIDDVLDLYPSIRIIPKTPAVATAALQELLWGIDPASLAGFSTAIPSPEQVLAYPGRTLAWGPRVTLRSLVIRDGVATADFSREINAYGGGAARVGAIREQIESTLKQFPTVSEVIIAVEGRVEDALQP